MDGSKTRSSMRGQFLTMIIGTSLVTLICTCAIFFSILSTSKAEVEKYRDTLIAEVEHELKIETETAIGVIDSIYKRQQAGELTEEQAKKEAADVIRDLRYDNGDGYFWIDTYEGVNVVLLGRENTEGKSRIDAIDPTGKYYIREMLENGRKPGGGYTDLMFAKPNETEPLPKRNYTVAFEPYHWVVGTGVWIDYIDQRIAEAQANADEELKSKMVMAVVTIVMLESILIVISVLLSGKINQPVRELTETVDVLTSGVIGCIVAIFIVGTVLLYYNMLHDERYDNIIKDGEIAAWRSADEFGNYLSSNIDSLMFAAYTIDEMLKDNRPQEEIQNFLVKQSEIMMRVDIGNENGLYGIIKGEFISGINWIPPEGYDAKQRPWYTTAIYSPEEKIVINSYDDLQTGKRMMSLGKLLHDGISVVSTDVPLDKAQELVEKAVSSGNADIGIIIDGKGNVIAHSDREEIGKNYKSESDTLGSTIFKNINRSSNSCIDINYQYTRYVVYNVKYLNDWHFISVRNTTNIFKSLHTMLGITILIDLIIVIIIVVLMMHFNKRRIMAENVGMQISTIANIYITMHELDLINNKFIEVLSGKEGHEEQIGKGLEDDCQQLLSQIMEQMAAPQSREQILDFVDFSKLDERLKNRNTITMEFLNELNQWCMARFIVAERLEDGRVARAMYLIEDIDESKKEREKLADASERAIAANQAKSSFLSNMSHEIRTPINAVLGMNEMILRESEDQNVLTYSENIRTAGNTLLGLVNDILDFSKIEAGKMEIIPVDYDVSSLLNDLVNMSRTKADNKGLELILDFDADMPKFLNGDEIRIKQIITNILTNAIKYTEKGSVTFSATYEKLPDDPNSVMLKVAIKDTGIGIKPEDIKKLFSKFERIEEKRNRNIEGTGLGMNITKALLEMMNSQLDVTSVYGSGSTFAFSLKQKVIRWEPLGDYETAYREAMASRSKYKESFKAPEAKVLVVDDNQMNLMVFTSLLKTTGVKIDRASSGNEGLALTDDKKYDIIFLDHMMPKKDGVETLHDLKARQDNPNLNTPTICLTANAISGAREQYIKEGFDDYLTKPIDSLKLEEMLIRYLPKEKIQKVARGEESDSSSIELPKELEPLAKEQWIDINVGLGNSGSVEAYMPLLKIFYTSMEESADEIDRFYENEDWKNYTIKVHAIKSSARIIGATEFGEKAQRLENAGKSDDTEYIRQHHKAFIDELLSFKEPLSKVFAEDESVQTEKPEADEDMMAEVYDGLRMAAEDMDSDTIQDILTEMENYRVTESETENWSKIKEAAKKYDYSSLLALLP